MTLPYGMVILGSDSPHSHNILCTSKKRGRFSHIFHPLFAVVPNRKLWYNVCN